MENTSPLKREYPLRSKQTIDTITGLWENGVKKMSVLIRHSARHYHKDPAMEPFMGLTPEGQSYAFDMGTAIPESMAPKLFASHIGRCIETAYLIDKGFTRTHGLSLSHTQTADILAPFYIKDIEKALELVKASGSRSFIREWFDRAVDPSVMEDPEKTAEILTGFMLDRLRERSGPGLAVCVSHDWNIYPIKEFLLGLPHEGAGDVGYLDGVIFYESQGQAFAATFQSGPKALKGF